MSGLVGSKLLSTASCFSSSNTHSTFLLPAISDAILRHFSTSFLFLALKVECLCSSQQSASSVFRLLNVECLRSSRQSVSFCSLSAALVMRGSSFWAPLHWWCSQSPPLPTRVSLRAAFVFWVPLHWWCSRSRPLPTRVSLRAALRWSGKRLHHDRSPDLSSASRASLQSPCAPAVRTGQYWLSTHGLRCTSLLAVPLPTRVSLRAALSLC